MYCSRSTGILAPSAMSRRRLSASGGMLPSCFDTRSNSCRSWTMASPRRVFSPGLDSYSCESSVEFHRVFGCLAGQCSP